MSGCGKLIKNVEIGELEVFPVSKNILSQIFKNYIVSPNANFYQPQEFTVNWEKLKLKISPIYYQRMILNW